MLDKLAMLTAGIVILFYNKKWANVAIRAQNNFWGSKYGENEIKGAKIVFALIGAFFIASSIMQLIGF